MTMIHLNLFAIIVNFVPCRYIPPMNTEHRESPQRAVIPTRTIGAGGLGLVAGLVIGSSLMYLLDPRQGNRRRALMRDRARSAASQSTVRAGKVYRHLRNKLEGAVANLTNTLRPEGAVSDRKLYDRIRSTVGRTTPYPQQVDFAVHGGHVTVRGNLKPHEAGQVILAVEQVPGVIRVDNQIVDASAVQ